MLTDMHTVLPAADIQRARTYYHDMFGMDPTEEAMGMLHFGSPDGGFDIYETPNAGTAKNTAMVWMTDDLDGDMAMLREKGVVFEDFEIPGMKTENGVAMEGDMRSAWFRDSEGNFIAITQRMDMAPRERMSGSSM
jgi:predicted enzyme related to lactoylglutathione lyase